MVHAYYTCPVTGKLRYRCIYLFPKNTTGNVSLCHCIQSGSTISVCQDLLTRHVDDNFLPGHYLANSGVNVVKPFIVLHSKEESKIYTSQTVEIPQFHDYY